MEKIIPHNKLHNLRNPYQGKAKKVLCVCSAGLLRSPTMANVLHREYGYNTRSCGMNDEYALVTFDDVLANWADEIVVVDEYNRAYISDMYNDKLTVLDIPDMYAFMDPELQKTILEQYKAAHENTTPRY